jgi:hypothetical protein
LRRADLFRRVAAKKRGDRIRKLAKPCAGHSHQFQKHRHREGLCDIAQEITASTWRHVCQHPAQECARIVFDGIQGGGVENALRDDLAIGGVLRRIDLRWNQPVRFIAPGNRGIHAGEGLWPRQDFLDQRLARDRPVATLIQGIEHRRFIVQPGKRGPWVALHCRIVAKIEAPDQPRRDVRRCSRG